MISEERITKLRFAYKDHNTFIRAIEREAHMQGQVDMWERAAAVAYEKTCLPSLREAIRNLEIEEPK